jgi:predicted GNAT family N-acyltransferase
VLLYEAYDMPHLLIRNEISQLLVSMELLLEKGSSVGPVIIGTIIVDISLRGTKRGGL